MSEPKQSLTNELLEQLLASASPEQYLDTVEVEQLNLSNYLNQLLESKHLKRSDVIQASGINPTFTYQIFQGSRRPSRDTAIMLAFGLQCTLREAQHLLRHAGMSELWCKIRRDAILIFCLQNGYSREMADDELYRLGEKTLLDEEKSK